MRKIQERRKLLDLTINGEINKTGHPQIIENFDPDFVIHRQGSMGKNHAVIEVKTSKDKRGIFKDFETIKCMVHCYDYKIGIFLIIGVDLNWFDKTGMRPCYVGEEDLTNFLRTFLCIPSRSYMNKKTGERVVIKDPSMAEGRLEYPEKLFAGDMSEIKQIMAFQPNNLIKAMLGVRTTDDNKQYQAVYTKKFLKNGATDYTSLAKNLESSRNAGMYSNVEFLAEPVREFSNTPTDFPADSQEKQPENNASKWSKAFNKEATK